MGYITQWDEFSVSAERLFLSSPLRSRLSLKYRGKEGVFVVKVTDDKTCLLFKSNQKSDIRKVEALDMRLLDIMTTKETQIDAKVEADTANAANPTPPSQ